MKGSKPWEQEHSPFFECFAETGYPDKTPASIAYKGVIFVCIQVRARNNKDM